MIRISMAVGQSAAHVPIRRVIVFVRLVDRQRAGALLVDGIYVRVRIQVYVGIRVWIDINVAVCSRRLLKCGLSSSGHDQGKILMGSAPCQGWVRGL